MNPFQNKNIEKNHIKIAIIIRNALGDFIAMTMPLCNYLESLYGECDFYFFYPDKTIRNKELIQYFFPKAHIFPNPPGNTYFQRFRLALKCRWIKPDIGISTVLNYPKTNSLFLFTIGTKERYARVANKLTSSLINHPYICADISKLRDRPIGLCSLQVFDPSIKEISHNLYPQFDTSKIPQHNLKYPGKALLVEVSNSKTFCQLSNTKCAAILNSLYKKHAFSILISAKSQDYKKAIELQNLLVMHSEIQISSTIRDFISFINAADIVLTGDGGLGHLAGALNKKIVALYSRTSPKYWGILGYNVTHLYDAKNVNSIRNEVILLALSRYF